MPAIEVLKVPKFCAKETYICVPNDVHVKYVEIKRDLKAEIVLLFIQPRFKKMQSSLKKRGGEASAAEIINLFIVVEISVYAYQPTTLSRQKSLFYKGRKVLIHRKLDVNKEIFIIPAVKVSPPSSNTACFPPIFNFFNQAQLCAAAHV